MDRNKLEKLLNECLAQLLSNDRYLINNDVHEQTISSKLAGYLSNRILRRDLGGWDVDVEYNRKGDTTKYLFEKDIVKPDIIIHRRGLCNVSPTDDNNLLVIEIKKDPKKNCVENDIKKIKGLMNSTIYMYRFGIILTINSRLCRFNYFWIDQ